MFPDSWNTCRADREIENFAKVRDARGAKVFKMKRSHVVGSCRSRVFGSFYGVEYVLVGEGLEVWVEFVSSV